MPRIAKKRNFKIKKKTVKNICRLIDNDKRCNNTSHSRGLCPKHHTYFLRHKLLEKYAAKKIFVYFDESKYKINKNPKKGQCRIIENTNKCKRARHGRGLCSKHWLVFSRHDVLLKYGLKSRKDPRHFAIKKRITKGLCRMIENNERCETKTASRGLCPKHHLRFLRSDELEKYGG